jgi:hypothetical protein
MIDDLIKTDFGIKLISAIWGLGISCLFRKVCKDRNCIVLKAPVPKAVNGKVYQYDNMCYEFIPYNTVCGKDTIPV